MISIFPSPNLKQKYLRFSQWPHYTASIMDPHHPNIKDRTAPYTGYDGNYWIDGDSLETATRIYLDSAGSNRLQGTGANVPSIWAGDDSGFVANLKKFKVSQESYIDTTDIRTWASQHIGQYANQISIGTITPQLATPANATNVRASMVGVAYSTAPDFTAITSTTTYSSTSIYKLGEVGQTAGTWNIYFVINMSAIGNVKPALHYTSQSHNHNLGNSTFGAKYSSAWNTAFTIDVRNQWTSSDGLGYNHIELDYVNAAITAVPSGLSITSTNWYIQYYKSSNNNNGYGNGHMTSMTYPLRNYGDVYPGNSPYNTCTGFYHNWMHMRINPSHCITDPTVMNYRLLMLSSTPNATGGDDNGNPPAGWYRETALGGVYTYWNGIKWIVES